MPCCKTFRLLMSPNYRGYTNYYTNAEYGPGSGPILLDRLGCTGTEARLDDCSSSSPTACTHSNDVSVDCRDPGKTFRVHVISGIAFIFNTTESNIWKSLDLHKTFETETKKVDVEVHIYMYSTTYFIFLLSFWQINMKLVKNTTTLISFIMQVCSSTEIFEPADNPF